jgi:hypothetical protein
MNASPIVRAVEAELAHYPGVEMEFHNRGKHDRIVFHRGEASRFLTVPKTASDWRAGNNALRDFRKTMRELGAPRLAPDRPRSRARKGFVAHLGMSNKVVVLHIPAASKLLKRFRTAQGRPTAHWKFSLRPSVDLTAPPLLVVTKAEVPAGKKVQQGLVGGFNVSGAWRLTMGRSAFPALDAKADRIPTVGLTLYEDKEGELVFQLPPGTIPTGFTKPVEPPFATPDERREFFDAKAPEPVEALAPAPAVAPPVAQSVALTNDQPIQLQLPKPGVSIEAAIAVLNKAKQRLGSNLRFTIEEGGFLSAVHRIGK